MARIERAAPPRPSERSSIRAFRETVASRHQYLRGLKVQGWKLVGYLGECVPEELLLAAGCHPIRLLPDPNVGTTTPDLQAFCCGIVRNILEQSRKGVLDYLDGAVIQTSSCDSLRNFPDILGIARPDLKVFNWPFPP